MWSEKFMSIFLPCVCHQKTDLGSLKFSFSVHFSVLILSSVQFSSVLPFSSVEFTVQFWHRSVLTSLFSSYFTVQFSSFLSSHSQFSSVHFSVLILSSVQFSSVILVSSVEFTVQFSHHSFLTSLFSSLEFTTQFSFSVLILNSVISSLFTPLHWSWYVEDWEN